ncbi:MAG: hypothetical protein AAF633_18920, partial [Chloroflexota bacterium]
MRQFFIRKYFWVLGLPVVVMVAAYFGVQAFAQVDFQKSYLPLVMNDSDPSGGSSADVDHTANDDYYADLAQ